jgi:hypothetical protein
MRQQQFDQLAQLLDRHLTRRTAAGALAAGWLSLTSAGEARRRRHKRKSGKRKKRRACPICKKRKGKARRCKPVADGEPCGECRVCHEGVCIAISDGVTCPLPDYCYTTVPDIYWQTNVADLIGMKTTADFEVKRQDIIDHIWKGAGLPAHRAAEIVRNVLPPISNIPGLSSVDSIRIVMGDLESYVSWFRPQVSNGRLVLYHAGHSHALGEIGADALIRRLVSYGFDVLGFMMPGLGPNTPLPDSDGPQHNVFATEETDTFSPLVYFIDPVPIAINTVLDERSFTDITMIGISGGGWTTTLAAAVDMRISTSFPIAGTLPLFLRTMPCSNPFENGDWEQYQAALWKSVDYTQLYVLGASGVGRRQVQVLNQYDSCCFWGVRYQVYEQVVADTVGNAGPGKFEVWLDSSTRNQHVISSWTQQRIIEALG